MIMWRLLILVPALCAKRGESSSRPEKWRQKLKAVLFEYKTKGEGGQKPTRQVGNASPTPSRYLHSHDFHTRYLSILGHHHTT